MLLRLQLLIIFYKDELKSNPDCIATEALLARSRLKLKKEKEKC